VLNARDGDAEPMNSKRWRKKNNINEGIGNWLRVLFMGLKVTRSISGSSFIYNS
jgi:hypothetical protein